MLQQGADHKWFLPIIEGYVGIKKLPIAGLELTCALISRRACTSQYPRGLDDDGEVGNFVETEQLILSPNGTYFGLTLVRGTVPVFWEQTGTTSRFSLTRSKPLTAPVFVDHMDALLKAYQKVLIINLLSTSKPHERVLSEAYREQIRMHQDKYENTISYLAYDYKAESKAGTPQELVRQASPMLLCHLYFSLHNKEILAWQKGVCRFNCLDCLDRTNAAMSRVAWYMLGWQVQALGRQVNIAFESEDAGLAVFKSLWAENGDVLSLQYTLGGGASLLLKSGKPGFLSMLEAGNSLDRLYSQAYEGHRKSEGYETLLGKFVLGSLTRTLQTLYVQRQVELREVEFVEEIEVNMRVITWNVCGQRPPSSNLIANFLFTADSEPLVIVVGLQDLVSADSQFQSTKNLAVIEGWIQMISVAFTRYSRAKYVMLKTDLQVGMLTLVYVQNTAASQVTSIDIDKVKTAVGSKGAVALRFNLYHSTICLCNVNLPAETVESGLDLLQEVETQAFQSESMSKKQKHRVSSHEVVVLFGGFNSFLTCSFPEAQQIYREKGLAGLRAADQLTGLLSGGRPGLAGFKEAELVFPPTIGFSALQSPGSETDTLPSWADRILYSGNCTFVQSYRSLEGVAERLPVCAELLLRLRKVNEEKKQRIEKEEVAKAAHMDMSLSLEPDAHRRTVSHNL